MADFDPSRLLALLLAILDDAERELLSGFTDHDSHVSAEALQAFSHAIRRCLTMREWER
jgi:hypothetical protein